MATNVSAPLDGTGYAGMTPTKAPDWYGLVTWDILFNNLAAGLFLVAAVGELTLPAVFAPVAKVAYPLALVFLIADLLCLVVDLGDPLRFHHMLRVFKPTSPMSLGTWCLAVYSAPLTVVAALSLFPSASPTLEWIRKAVVILAILPALGSATYKGVLLSTNAQPGWREARWLGGYLNNSALMLGCAGLLGIAVLLGEARATSILRSALLVLLVLNAFVLVLLIANLRPVLVGAFTGRLWRIGLGIIGGGILLPWCLLLIGGPASLLIAVLLILLGSLAIRFVIITIPHRV
jgi:hypothetical protein